MKLWYDNQVALHIVTNHFFHERFKPIAIDCYFIQEKIPDIATSYDKKQLHDIFQKA